MSEKHIHLYLHIVPEKGVDNPLQRPGLPSDKWQQKKVKYKSWPKRETLEQAADEALARIKNRTDNNGKKRPGRPKLSEAEKLRRKLERELAKKLAGGEQRNPRRNNKPKPALTE